MQSTALTIYRNWMRANFLQSMMLMLSGLCVHLFLLSFTAENDAEATAMPGKLATGFGITLALYFFFWWFRNRRLQYGDKSGLRYWYLDCVLLAAFPFSLYVTNVADNPFLTLMGCGVIVWQIRALYRSSYLTARQFLRNRLSLRRMMRENKDDSGQVGAHLNSWCLTCAIILAFMIAYNGGRPYTEAQSMLAIAARAAFASGVLLFLWWRVILALYHRYWRHQMPPWPFWLFMLTMPLLPLVLAMDRALILVWIIPAVLLHLLCGCLFLHYAGGRPSRLWEWLLLHPAHLLACSFVIIITIGSYLLSLPCCDSTGQGLYLQDALFTATSAVCVTGLCVIDVAHRLTDIGQIILAVLIQLGSLGIMTVGSFFALSFGHRLGVLESSALRNMTGEERSALAKRLIRTVILLSIAIESIGVLCLTSYFIWDNTFGDNGEALKQGIFLALNSFCNSGFSILPNSCMQLQHAVIPLLLLSVLITIGALGYQVLANLWSRLFERRPLLLPPHVKLILYVSAILTLCGTLMIYVCEYSNSLNGLSWDERLANALFQAQSCRTAGFNSVDVSAWRPVTRLFTVFLMFCGGAPGSNAGGIRVTTVGILVMLVCSMIRGRREVVLFHTTVSEQTIRQAIAVLLTALTSVFAATLLLSARFPDVPPMAILFETVSAIGTVGLSSGFTAQLDLFGKIVMIALMLAGRIGFLTLISLLSADRTPSHIHYPTNRIMIG